MIVLYPELDGKMLGTPVLPSGWLQRDAGSGSGGHLRTGIHESNFNTWCDEYEGL